MIKELQPHQQRVVQEYDDLHDKTLKLSQFMDTKVYAALDDDEKERLIHQWKVMQEYGMVLMERIGAFR